MTDERVDELRAALRKFVTDGLTRAEANAILARTESPAPSPPLPTDVQGLIGRAKEFADGRRNTQRQCAKLLDDLADALERMAREVVWWKSMAAQVDRHVARIRQLEAEREREEMP
jgi:cell division septum initiation protein DivIVA